MSGTDSGTAPTDAGGDPAQGGGTEGPRGHEAGGRTFWRLRVAGFEDRDAARKFCAALIEAGGDCIPAVAK